MAPVSRSRPSLPAIPPALPSEEANKESPASVGIASETLVKRLKHPQAFHFCQGWFLAFVSVRKGETLETLETLSGI
jgi:hypothetical protein